MNEFTLAFINCWYTVHKSPVRYFDSFIAIEMYIYMTSMVMLGITMEVSINKSLLIKGKTQAKLGHSWALFGILDILALALGNFTLLDSGLNSVEIQNNLLDKCLI